MNGAWAIGGVEETPKQKAFLETLSNRKATHLQALRESM